VEKEKGVTLPESMVVMILFLLGDSRVIAALDDPLCRSIANALRETLSFVVPVETYRENLKMILAFVGMAADTAWEIKEEEKDGHSLFTLVPKNKKGDSLDGYNHPRIPK
jgi:hypothetical protein